MFTFDNFAPQLSLFPFDEIFPNKTLEHLIITKHQDDNDFDLELFYEEAMQAARSEKYLPDVNKNSRVKRNPG